MLSPHTALLVLETDSDYRRFNIDRTAKVDILAVQEEISREISERLRFKLTGEDRRRLARRYTESAQAYQLYLKGRYHWLKKTAAGFDKAIEYFEKAIEADPS